MLLPAWRGDAGTGFEQGGTLSTIRITTTLQRSVTDVVTDSAAFQWGTLIGGYAVLVAYGALSHAGLGRQAPARSHAALGAWGIVAVSMATLMSFGAYGYLRIPSTGLAAGVLPFVSLGVGAVDMFVLSEAYVDAVRGAAAAGRGQESVISGVLRSTGPSITFTTLINLVASLVAAQVRSTRPLHVDQSFLSLEILVLMKSNLKLGSKYTKQLSNQSKAILFNKNVWSKLFLRNLRNLSAIHGGK